MAEPISLLAGVRRPGRHGAGPASAVLTEAPAAAIVQVTAFAGQEAALAAALGRLGLPALPGPGDTAGAGDTVVAAIAPARWLLLSLDDAGLADRVRLALAGDVASAVDLGHARTRLILSGPRARDVLAKGVPVDLSADALPAGRVVTSKFAETTVQIRVLDDAAFELLVMSSFAASLWSEIAEAAAEWGYEVR